MRSVTGIAMCVVLAGCSAPVMAVRGDSTAIASREGAAKAFNLAPSLDGKRWWNIVRRTNFGGKPAFNDGVGGQDIQTMREKMEAELKETIARQEANAKSRLARLEQEAIEAVKSKVIAAALERVQKDMSRDENAPTLAHSLDQITKTLH